MSDTRANEFRCILRVRGEATAERITGHLRLSPTEAWDQGSPRPRGIGVRDQMGWVLESGIPTAAPLEDHIQAQLSRLEARAAEIKTVPFSVSLTLVCVVYWYESCNPGIALSNAVVQRAAALGLSIEFDIYVLAPGD